ncbi:MAG: hypothetical protein E7564_04210 [Ruminococcaceae bacterium]|nr:hypothetical protein [Oscillospiraceae bacterium]
MKKHISIFIAFILILSLTLGGVFITRLFDIGDNYLNHLEISYRGALGQLGDNLEKTSLTLKKIKYSSGDNLQHKATDTIISCCSAAKAGAAALPFSENNSGKIESLLSICEDYARYIGNKIAREESPTAEELENFNTLSIYIDKLNEECENIRNNLGSSMDEKSISTVLNVFNRDLALPEGDKFDAALKKFSEESEAFQGLVYDGPFSSHIKRRIALYLENKEEITKEEAINIAADFLDADPSLLKCEFETDGALSAFEITGENLKALVTKKGGEISFAKKTGDYVESNLNYEDALKEAKEFLSESGFDDNIKETSFVINDNTCTINFYPVQNGILLYPDLIKITVELKEGKMVEYEAEGYLMNHRERGNLTPALSPDEAKSKINENLSITSYSLALIPTEGENEVLCYEFTCEYENESEKVEILSYINAENGEEEQLFFVERGENHIYYN